MKNKKIAIIMCAALLMVPLQGCSTGQSAQPQSAAPTQNKPTDTAAEKKAPSVDLTQELHFQQHIEIGKTTLKEMIKAYGKPVNMGVEQSSFHTDLAKQGLNGPTVSVMKATFKVNPVTGKPFNQAYPFFFTNDDEQVMVAAPVLLLRNGLLEKMKSRTITLDDVKKVYGQPARASDNAMEFIDFDHKISLVVVKAKEGVGSMLTKYDLMYGDKTQDVQAYDDMMNYFYQKETEAKK